MPQLPLSKLLMILISRFESNWSYIYCCYFFCQELKKNILYFFVSNTATPFELDFTFNQPTNLCVNCRFCWLFHRTQRRLISWWKQWMHTGPILIWWVFSAICLSDSFHPSLFLLTRYWAAVRTGSPRLSSPHTLPPTLLGGSYDVPSVSWVFPRFPSQQDMPRTPPEGDVQVASDIDARATAACSSPCGGAAALLRAPKWQSSSFYLKGRTFRKKLIPAACIQLPVYDHRWG